MANAISITEAHAHSQVQEQVQEQAVATPKVEAAVESQELTGWAKILDEAEFNRYGLMIPFILATCCMGGVGLWAMGNAFNIPVLVILACCTVLPLSLMLAVAPMKQVIPACVASVLISALITVIYLV